MKIGLVSFLAALAAATSSALSVDFSVATDDCTLTGTYVNGTDVSKCESILIDSLTVPAGITLDLSNVTDGASITFEGTTTFGTKLWDGPLVLLKGNKLTVGGSGTLDGQGSWYWPQGQKVTRPVFFRMRRVMESTLSDFKIQNMPYRTFSILNSNFTTIDGLTLDSSAGDGLAKNTDGFDMGRNNGVTIKNCKVHNQDDCLAMQSSKNTLFTNNLCVGGHGISIGSLGGAAVDDSTTLDGLTVSNNQIVNNTNGIRIKTIIGLQGIVTNVNYINNTVTGVKNAIVVHSDYNKTKGGYSGIPSSVVTITNININGLKGDATNVYDIKANPDVVSDWSFNDIDVTGSAGNCTGQPSNIQCVV